MVYKCPNCGSFLKYNPATKLMECESCISMFTVAKLEDLAAKAAGKEEALKAASGIDISLENDDMFKRNRIECRIYRCLSCGADLIINDQESATYCAYCGQPTIVFDRVSNELKPDYIIPFSVTKEKALELIKKRLKNGNFVPSGLKSVDPELVRGIYIPYWLFDIHHRDIAYLKACRQDDDKKKRYFYYVRDGECEFKDLSLDATTALPDAASRRLEPYDMNELIPFDPAYLSGFYADRFDLDEGAMARFASERAREIFDAEIKKSVSAKNAEFCGHVPRAYIKRASYVLLPAWFVIFRYGNRKYTLMVNGQSMKVVGTVPFSKGGAALFFTLFAVILSAAFGVMALMLPHILLEELLSFAVVGFVLFSGFMLKKIHRLYGSISMGLKITGLKGTVSYVRERTR